MSDILVRPRLTEGILTFRNAKYLFCWLMLWQGNMVGGSLLQIDQLTNGIPGGFSIVEVFAALLAITVWMERTVSEDFSFRRTYFNGPMALIALVFFVSWLRGSVMLQRYAGILEAHEVFELPFAYFIVSNAFRDSRDREALMRMILLAAVAKGFDGISVYFFSHDPSKSWGVIMLWRDAYEAAVGIACAFAFYHYRGHQYKSLRTLFLICSPIILAVMILGVRRAAMVASFGAAFSMFLYLPGGARKRHLVVLSSFIILVVLVVLVTDPINIIARFSGIVSPQGEGSAYIRVLEYPNVLLNIVHNPIWGVPVGVTWKTYYRMPISADYTTLGTHNAYLYWPLRAGVFGLIAYWWLIGRAWKSALISYRLRRSAEDFVLGLCLIQMLLVYAIASMFGLLYGDYMSTFMAVVFTLIQLHAREVTGRSSLKEISFWSTMRRRYVVFHRNSQAKLVHSV